MDSNDPVVSNPTLYRVLFENERVRVLEYRDRPGDLTTAHDHPDSVMVTLSTFRRRLVAGGNSIELQLQAGLARWLPAQRHFGENTGDTATHVLFVELKEPSVAPSAVREPRLGPAG
jgi:hypothetical protein